jgi:hypothetical protein
MILKQVIKYTNANAIEATWVDADDKQVKCHSYADVQMDMLTADLGADAAEYADLIATVTAGIKPHIPPSTVVPEVISMAQARLALHAAGLLEQVEAGVSLMGKKAQIEWEFRATVDRKSALVTALAIALVLDDAALDALFTAAAAL